MSKAVILLSGGLDSTTVLAIAKSQGYDCYALSFDYGQKQISELDSSISIAKKSNVIEHRIMKISLSDIGGSALTDQSIDVPKYSESDEIPITYVPARNTIFLSFALAWAEVVDCQTIFIGVNALDYSETTSCYDANTLGEACGECDACVLRKIGFENANVQDPTRYQ